MKVISSLSNETSVKHGTYQGSTGAFVYLPFSKEHNSCAFKGVSLLKPLNGAAEDFTSTPSSPTTADSANSFLLSRLID